MMLIWPELIENLDKPDKQVLVEVFMVNVAKNWQRQLQGRLQNALRLDNMTDPDVAAISDADQANCPASSKCAMVVSLACAAR